MAKAKTQARARSTALPPGLHVGLVEMAGETDIRVRLLDGTRTRAACDPSVDPALIGECLRTGRRVLLVAGKTGPTIIGAVQTSRSVEYDVDGRAVLRAREIRLRAEEGVSLETGTVSLRLESGGAVRIEGNRMVIDVSSLLKVLSAQVELP